MKVVGRLLFLAILTVSCKAVSQPSYSVLNAERLWQMVRIGSPAISPDGRWAALTVTAYGADADLPSVDLWLVATDGKDEPRQLTRNPGEDFAPAWAPDSQSLVYTSARSGQTSSQIWLLNLRGGEPLPLTDLPASATRPRFSPDGASVLFQTYTYPDINDDFERLAERHSQHLDEERWAIASDYRQSPVEALRNGLVQHIFRLELETGQITDLMPGISITNGIRPLEWDLSPNGELLAYSANSSAPPYKTRNGDVFLLSIREPGQPPINLTTGHAGADFRPLFTRAGNALLFGRRQQPDSLSDLNQLIRHDLRDGSQRSLTDGQSLSPQQWRSSADGRQTYFTAIERGRRKLFRVSNNKPRQLLGEGSLASFELGPQDRIYYLQEDFFTPPTLHGADRNGLHPRKLTRFNDLLIQYTRFGSFREFEVTGANGDPIHGFVVYPAGFNEQRKWPLIVALHGGPHSTWLEAFSWRWNLAALASGGYVVAAVNFHGSTGYGRVFAQSINGAPLSMPAEDVIKATTALLADPALDAKRVALVGGSYGGLLANWVLTQSQLYSAAAIHAGVFDLAAQYSTDFPWGREQTWGALPWQQPAAIDALSPSRLAANIKTPVLLLHGAQDTRVAPMHSRYLHNILTYRGVASRLVVFPEEGHSITQRQSALRWWREIFAWLEQFAPAGPQ